MLAYVCSLVQVVQFVGLQQHIILRWLSYYIWSWSMWPRQPWQHVLHELRSSGYFSYSYCICYGCRCGFSRVTVDVWIMLIGPHLQMLRKPVCTTVATCDRYVFHQKNGRGIPLANSVIICKKISREWVANVTVKYLIWYL